MAFFYLCSGHTLGCSTTSSPANSGRSYNPTCNDNRWSHSLPPQIPTDKEFGIGQTIPDLQFLNQHGDEVCIWQFHGNNVLPNRSAVWPGVSTDLALFVEQTQSDLLSQEVIYATVLPEDSVGNLPSVQTLSGWATTYSIESAPILAPTEDLRPTFVPDGNVPTVWLLSRELQILNEKVLSLDDSNNRSEIEAA